MASMRERRSVSDKTIGRLTLYRRILTEITAQGGERIHSHELAERAGATAAQVRRDLMVTGCEGKPNRGYVVGELLASLHAYLDKPGGQRAALVGLGNLGRALLAYFAGRQRNIAIAAAFDIDEKKVGREFRGCRCHPIRKLDPVIGRESVEVAVIAVPAKAAQEVADALVHCGVKALLNFAPVALQVPPDVHVENVDLTMSLEKVAFYARGRSARRKPRGA